MQIATTLRNWRAGFTGYATRMGGTLAALCMLALLTAVPSAQAQIQNGGFESQTFANWTLKDYTRSTASLAGGDGQPNSQGSHNLSFVAPTQFSQLTLDTFHSQLANGVANQNATYRSVVLTSPGTAPNTSNIVTYPFMGSASARLGNDGGRKATVIEQTATMSLADVDEVDGKVHVRFALAPVLYDAGHNAWRQPFFFVEVRNLSKGGGPDGVQLFNTFNFANQAGIPWTKVGNYRSTNWQGFDISPGNGQLDPGDSVLVRVVVANCADGGSTHIAQVYMDVFGSKMPGLSVVATGPSTTKPAEQITYNYNYTNNSGVYALDAWVRLAAPVTEDGKYLTFVPGTYPATCTGIHSGISPRADYIDCPVGDLVAGAGGNFNVTFTVPADAATNGPNNVINNGDYDVRASTVSPFIGPLVKTNIVGASQTLLDLGITIGNGGVPSYLVGGMVTYTVTVTNNGPIDVVDAVITQNTLSGVVNPSAATWTCSPGAGTATCGGTSGVSSGTGLLNTIGSLPVGQSLTYTIIDMSAQVAGTPVVTTVSVAPPAGLSDSVAANNTAGLSTPVSAAQYTLTVNTAGSGLGGVNAVPAALACSIAAVPAAACSTQQLGGSDDAYLTAVAGTKTVFKGWSGDCTIPVAGNQCHVNMAAANREVTAEFARAWVVTPTVIGGTWGGDPLVEDGQAGTITVTPNVAGQVPTVSAGDTCNVVQSGPVGGVYTFTTAPMSADCAFTVTFPSPQLTVTKNASVTNGAVGTAFTYTVTVTNSGAVDTTAATSMTDMVPVGLTLNSVAPAGGTTCAAVAGQLASCTIPAGLAAGDSRSFTITVTPTAATVGTTVHNTASVSGGGDTACPVANPCRSNTVSTSVGTALLSIAKSASVTTAVVGVPFDYTLTVTNSGMAATSAAATVTDVVPTGLAIGTLPTGCALSAPGSQTVICTIAAGLSNVAGSNTVSFVIPVTPEASVNTTTVSNTAGVQGGGDPGCATAGACTSTTVNTPVTAPALTIAKSASVTTAVVGVAFNYTLTVTNGGTAATTAVTTVTDVVPAGLAIGALSTGCALSAPGSQTVICTIASGLSQTAPSNTVSFVIPVTPEASVNTTTVSNTAGVQGGGDPGCATAGACTSTTVNTPVTAPALSIAKSASVTTAVVGVAFNYTLTVTNGGTAATTAVTTVTDVVPAGLVIGALPTGCTLSAPGSQTVICTIASGLSQTAPSNTVSFVIPVTPEASVNNTTVPNTAGVQGGGDPGCATAGTCTSTTVNTPVTAPKLEITKSGPATAVVGMPFDYTLTVSNTGTADAIADAVVTDTVPAGLVIVDAPSCVIAGQGVTCTVAQASLQAGGSVTITINVVPAVAGNVSNTARVTGGGDPACTSGCNSPPVATTVAGQNPGLSIIKSVTSTGPYGVGDVIAYAFELENTGNVTLTGVSVTDTLAGLSVLTYGWPGASGQLLPGQRATATASYVVTAADVAAGYVHNSATADGQPPTVPGGTSPPPVSSPPSVVNTPTAQAPSLNVNKSVTSTGPYRIGSVIAYAFEVENTGDVTLTDVSVSDPLSGLGALSYVWPGVSGQLQPGQTATATAAYTVTAADAAAGHVHNSATVSGQPPTVPGGPTPTPITSPPSVVDTPIQAVIDAVDDAPPAVNGADGNPSLVNAYENNDTFNGAPVDTSKITGTVMTPATPINGGPVPVLDPVTGMVSVPPGTPADVYTIVYRICETQYLDNCDDAVVTVTVTAPVIDAVEDVLPPVNGADGSPNVGNVYANDTLNGVPVEQSKIDGTVTTPATPINGGSVPVLDPVTGVVSVPPGTPAGDYTITYRICEKLNPGNCDSTTVTVTVSAPVIDAVEDVLPPVNGADGSANAGNVYDNDTLNGVPVDPTRIDGTVTTPATPINGGSVPVLDPVTGVVSVSPGTPAGDYTITYRICEKLNPGNCDSTTVTVTVSAPVIDAVEDVLPPVNGADGSPNVGNVYANDTLNGVPVEQSKIDGTVTTPATPINGGSVPVLDPVTGVVSVPPGTPAGDYTITYRICEKLNPGNCDTTTVTVTVTAPVLVVVDPNLPPLDGGDGTPNGGNIHDGITVDGKPVDPSRVTVTVTTPATPINGGSVPVLDPATGVVSVPPGTPAGDYTITYRVCEKLNPDNCVETTLRMTVTAPVIDAVDDTPAPVRSGEGGSTPSVLGNDTVGGRPAQPGSVTLQPGVSPHPGLVMGPDGSVSIARGIPQGEYRYPYTICEVLNPTNCDTAEVILTISGEALLRVVKTAGVREVRIGDLVRYTLTLENLGDGVLVNGSVIDTPPAGFSYVESSLLVDDADGMASVSGQRPLRFDGLDIPVGGTARLVYMMRVGAGVRAGTLVNQAQAYSPDGEPLSNVATAEVMLVADPLIDDSLVFGTVFNDRDGDGWQDSAALSGVKVQGGFAAGAYVANSTTVDRGAGMQPEADASSPLLHGIAVGAIAGRQSEADLPENHQVVIRQTLRELSFTDDFVLTSDQGVTVRMDRNGATTVEKSGEAAKGLNAAAPTVERSIAQGADGYVVDYVVRNAGIDERGIPGVRIASVEGLLIETDQFGRYHLAGVNGGAWERGRNFILKVDPATLPAGAEFSTDNPLLRRVTPGVPVRFDWGVKLPVQVIEGGSRQEELEMGEVFFAPGSAEVPARYQPVVEAIAGKLREHPKAEVVIQATANSEALAFERTDAIKAALLAQLDEATARTLVVTARATVDEASSLVAGVTGEGVLLGTVLFDTDKSAIRPEFEALLDKVAAALEQRGGGSVSIVGHTDVRASHAYNTALGLRRAKAVFDALASRLSPAVRGKLRVETENVPAASAGKRK